MPAVKKVPSKGLHRMWFREDGQRDLSISREEWEKRWMKGFAEFCEHCRDVHHISDGKCSRMVGTCGICGRKDVFIVGRLGNDHESISRLMIEG
jgi:hypothetical protein